MSHKMKSFVFIFLCGMCWGPSYLLIKIALPEIPPLSIAFGRNAIGFLFILTLCLLQKHRLFSWKKHWKDFLVMGITLNALPFFLISYSELYISSSLAGILNSFTLIFTAILSHFFAQEPFTKNKALGVGSGIVGLCFIYVPFLFSHSLGSLFGAFLMILATLCYGTGTVYARLNLHKTPGLITLTYQMLIAAILLFPFSFLEQTHLPSSSAILALIGLGIIGTGAGYIFYYKAIEIAGATYASFATLLIPIIAMILGVGFLHEEITWNLYVGVILIFAGVVGVNPALNKR